MKNDLNVMCCFCGESLFFDEAVTLLVYVNYKSEEPQQLFCHKRHFVEKMHESVVLLPPLLNDKESEG